MNTVEDILKNKNIYYKSSGGDWLISCLNPEHEDKNPSMRIDKLTGIFNCFSCNYSGSLYKLFDVSKNITDIQCIKLRDKIMTLLQSSLSIPLGAEIFQKEYRNIKPETFKHFNAFTHPTFEGQVVFPITDIYNNIVVFQARQLYSNIQPKYIFTPEHRNIPLFPAKPSIINNSIILVEGLFDMLNLFDKGLPNAVCTFGVSFASAKNHTKQVRQLQKLEPYKMQGVNTIYILYDGDTPGQKASKNLEKILNKDYIVETIELNEDVDPGDLTFEDVQRLKNMLYNN